MKLSFHSFALQRRLGLCVTGALRDVADSLNAAGVWCDYLGDYFCMHGDRSTPHDQSLRVWAPVLWTEADAAAWKKRAAAMQVVQVAQPTVVQVAQPTGPILTFVFEEPSLGIALIDEVPGQVHVQFTVEGSASQARGVPVGANLLGWQPP